MVFRRKREKPVAYLDEMGECPEFAFIELHARNNLPSSKPAAFPAFSDVQPFAGRTDML